MDNGEVITRVAEVSTDTDRAKIRASDSIVWVPYADIDHGSMVGNMLH